MNSIDVDLQHNTAVRLHSEHNFIMETFVLSTHMLYSALMCLVVLLFVFFFRGLCPRLSFNTSHMTSHKCHDV